jgi:hypothetical protein
MIFEKLVLSSQFSVLSGCEGGSETGDAYKFAVEADSYEMA